MNLYELNEAIAKYEMQFDEETGEWLNEDELTELNIAKEEKIESICLWIKNLLAEASAIKSEEENLKKRREAKENKAESLKKYIASYLNGEKFETPRVRVSFRKSEKIEITDESLIPEAYMKIEVVRKPVKDLIKKAIKGDIKVEGAKLISNQTVSIK